MAMPKNEHERRFALRDGGAAMGSPPRTPRAHLVMHATNNQKTPRIDVEDAAL